MHVTTQLWSAEKVEWAAFPRRPGICAKSLGAGFPCPDCSLHMLSEERTKPSAYARLE